MGPGPRRDAVPGALRRVRLRARLRAHLRVAGEVGRQGLIPTTERFGTALADIVRCGVLRPHAARPMPDAATLTAAYDDAASDDYVEPRRPASGRPRGGRWSGSSATRRAARCSTSAAGSGSCSPRRASAAGRRSGSSRARFASALRARAARARRAHDDLYRGAAGGRFDAVVMGDVIEHLPDAGGALERVRALLAPRRRAVRSAARRRQPRSRGRSGRAGGR